MSDAIAWRPLHQCGDLLQARAIATCIAAMEFEVRLSGDEFDGDRNANQALVDQPQAPFCVEVPQEHWQALRNVLDEIIAEQIEFDQRLQARQAVRNAKLIYGLALAAALETLLALRMIGS